MGLFAVFGAALSGLKSMAVGLKVTGTNFFKPQETVHYPRQEVDTLSTFRGHIELVCKDEDKLAPRCVGCGLCAELCPSNCIRVDTREPSPAACDTARHPVPTPLIAVPKFRTTPPDLAPVAREVTGYHLTYHTCSLCGLCVQNCPAGAIRFSSNVYFAGMSRGAFEIDLMARLREQADKRGREQ
jgi:NADH-quinone oxidoreductase subunit I